MALYAKTAISDLLRHVALMSAVAWNTVTRFPLILKIFPLTVEQMYRVGIQSFSLVSVTALFLGAETVIQAEYQFSGFIPLKLLGTAVCKGLVNELGPVVTSLVVSARVSTGIAAEIGSMKATEQLDAMKILRLDPFRYLFLPRTIACMIMLPVLTIWSELLAILASIITVIVGIDVTLYTYMEGLKFLFNPTDLFVGIARTVVFGAIIALSGCHFGLQARGGAEGVGNATTKAVMTAAVLILVFDFAISSLVW